MKIIRRSFLVSCVATLMTTQVGCASSPSSGGTEGVDSRLTDTNAQFFSKSGAASCVVGSLLGALTGVLACKDKKLACAAAGAVVGCGAAMTANYVLDDIRSKYKKTEDQLDVLNLRVQGAVTKTNKIEDDMNSVVADDKAEVAKLTEEFKVGTKSKEDLKAKQESMQKNIAYLQGNLKGAEDYLTSYKTARDEISKNVDAGTDENQQKIKELDAQIATLENKITDLKSAIADYANLSNTLVYDDVAS